MTTHLFQPLSKSLVLGHVHRFIFSLLEGSLDSPHLLTSISFRVPTHSFRNHSFFNCRSIVPFMGSTTHCIVCYVVSIQLSLGHFSDHQCLFNNLGNFYIVINYYLCSSFVKPIYILSLN